MTQRKIEYWVIPPQADAELCATIREVLQFPPEPGSLTLLPVHFREGCWCGNVAMFLRNWGL